LLFLSAGALIHGIRNEQDGRRATGLLMPVTAALFTIGSASLVAATFFAGYYSKDFVLECAFSQYSRISYIASWLGSTTALLTLMYSYNIYNLAFSECQGQQRVVAQTNDLPLSMLVTLAPLLVGAVVSGYVCRDFFIGFGNDF